MTNHWKDPTFHSCLPRLMSKNELYFWNVDHNLPTIDLKNVHRYSIFQNNLRTANIVFLVFSPWPSYALPWAHPSSIVVLGFLNVSLHPPGSSTCFGWPFKGLKLGRVLFGLSLKGDKRRGSYWLEDTNRMTSQFLSFQSSNLSSDRIWRILGNMVKSLVGSPHLQELGRCSGKFWDLRSQSLTVTLIFSLVSNAMMP